MTGRILGKPADKYSSSSMRLLLWPLAEAFLFLEPKPLTLQNPGWGAWGAPLPQ